MLILSKVLPLFVLPLGVTLLLLLWGLIRRRTRPIWAGVVILLVSSNPIVGHSLIRTAENWAARKPVGEISRSDAIVVLSAGRVVAPGTERFSEWSDANRFFGGVELFHAGKAPLLVFTGAWLPWEPDAQAEGQVLSIHARAMGVPADRIVVTGRVSNTAEEASAVWRILRRDAQFQRPRVILVTSAFHMQRARRLFEEQGLLVDPFPVSFSSSQGAEWTVMDLLPSVGAMGQTQTALRELYGRAFNWLRRRWSPSPELS